MSTLGRAVRRLPTPVLRSAAAVFVLALILGHLSLGRGVDLSALISGTDELSSRIFWELRVPRTAVALLAGAALGCSGLLLQALLRNPLASPEMTAINPAAVLAVLAATAAGWFRPDNVIAMALAALVGGVLGGSLMWWISRGHSPGETAVAGLITALALSGGTTLILTARPTGLAGSLRWLIGGLDGVIDEHVMVLAPAVLLGVTAVIACAVPVELLSVGDSHARTLGVDVDRWRLAGLALATVLAAAAVSVTGPLAFVGFLAPHVTRLLRPGRLAQAVPWAVVVGGAFVLGCDLVAVALSLLIQSTGDGHQTGIPTGAVTCIVGAAALVVAARRVPPGELE